MRASIQNEVPKIRVLVAGLNVSENQFTRSIRKKGCEVVHTDANEKSYPTDADMVVLVKCQLASNKGREIRDVYRAKNKPILSAEQGFSEISEQFDMLVFELRGAKAKALETPVKKTYAFESVWRKQAEEFNAAQAIETLMPRPKKILTEGTNLEDATKLYNQYTKEGYSPEDAVELLVDQDFATSDGEPLTPIPFLPLLTTEQPAMDLELEEVLPSSPPPPPPVDESPLFMIPQVLASTNLNDAAKLNIIEQITKGTITRLKARLCVVRKDPTTGEDMLEISVSSLVNPKEDISLKLDRRSVNLMFDYADQIERFAEGRPLQ